jgi:hypothetical protein
MLIIFVGFGIPILFAYAPRGSKSDQPDTSQYAEPVKVRKPLSYQTNDA